MKCDNCLSKSDLGFCQNFKSPCFKEPVEGKEQCELFEMKGREEEYE